MAVRTLLAGLVLMGCTSAKQSPVATAEPLAAAALPAERSPSVVDNFTIIKRFILSHGDKETYGNKYNDNPHYRFEGFDAYLNPEGGQKNINCDPRRSDFDEIIIRDVGATPRYRSARRTIVQDRPVMVFEPETGMEPYFEQMLTEIQVVERRTTPGR